MTPENCIFSCYFADKYQYQELKEKSHETINSHFSVVMETDDFVNLDVSKSWNGCLVMTSLSELKKKFFREF